MQVERESNMTFHRCTDFSDSCPYTFFHVHMPPNKKTRLRIHNNVFYSYKVLCTQSLYVFVSNESRYLKRSKGIVFFYECYVSCILDHSMSGGRVGTQF